MNETNTYQNWRAVTEADFVSLFIKTWFAYISTLRVMYPEAKNKRGDGKYLKTHKEHYKGTTSLRLVVDDQIQSHIEAVYAQGRKIIMEQFPEYYLWDFYRINDNFDYIYKDIPPDKSDCLIVGLKMNKNRGSKWGFTISGFFRCFGKYYGQDYNENINFQYDISEILNDTTEYIRNEPDMTEQSFLTGILSLIHDNLSLQLLNTFKSRLEQKNYGKRITSKLSEKALTAVAMILSVFNLNGKDESQKTKEEMDLPRNTYEIITQLPNNYYQYHFDVPWQPNREMTASEKRWYEHLLKNMRSNSVLWFLDFVYRLRNALFHEIIDPLNEDWQLVFKNAYLVLKEIVDKNIDYINSINAQDALRQ